MTLDAIVLAAVAAKLAIGAVIGVVLGAAAWWVDRRIQGRTH